MSSFILFSICETYSTLSPIFNNSYYSFFIFIAVDPRTNLFAYQNSLI